MPNIAPGDAPPPAPIHIIPLSRLKAWGASPSNTNESKPTAAAPSTGSNRCAHIASKQPTNTPKTNIILNPHTPTPCPITRHNVTQKRHRVSNRVSFA